MSITHIYAFLVHPSKGEEPKELTGFSVPLAGDLFEHMNEVYRRSQSDCTTEVVIIPDNGGSGQTSVFRETLFKFAKNGDQSIAKQLAEKLSNVTTKRSGLGLLFAIRAVANGGHQILLSRFPTDSAILVDDAGGGLNVKFLEKVFVKTHFTYKAALFNGQIAKGEFWEGRVLDKQIGHGKDEASLYWVRGFLSADFKVTSTHGTQNLARALSDSSAGASFDEKRELHHLAAIVENLDGQRTSVDDMIKRFNVSENVAKKIKSKLPKNKSANEEFTFSRMAYNSIISFRTVETDKGAIITAQSATFNEIIKYETISKDGTAERVRLTTEGILLADKLKRAK